MEVETSDSYPPHRGRSQCREANNSNGNTSRGQVPRRSPTTLTHGGGRKAGRCQPLPCTPRV